LATCRHPGELHPELVRQARLFVETRGAFEPPPVGGPELSGLDPSLGTELGEVLLGWRPGRQDDTELTVNNAVGHGVEDMGAAALALGRAKAAGGGRTIVL